MQGRKGDSVQVDVKWQGKTQFAGTGETGHTILMEAGPDAGGEGAGTKPTELVLMAVAGCSGIDIINILTKMREKVEDFTITVDGDRRDEPPQRFTAIRVTYRLRGEVKPASVERAIRLSLDKYCSVANSITASITFAFEVNGVRYPERGFTA